MQKMQISFFLPFISHLFESVPTSWIWQEPQTDVNSRNPTHMPNRSLETAPKRLSVSCCRHGREKENGEGVEPHLNCTFGIFICLLCVAVCAGRSVQRANTRACYIRQKFVWAGLEFIYSSCPGVGGWHFRKGTKQSESELLAKQIYG